MLMMGMMKRNMGKGQMTSATELGTDWLGEQTIFLSLLSIVAPGLNHVPTNNSGIPSSFHYRRREPDEKAIVFHDIQGR